MTPEHTSSQNGIKHVATGDKSFNPEIICAFCLNFQLTPPLLLFLALGQNFVNRIFDLAQCKFISKPYTKYPVNRKLTVIHIPSL